MSDIAIRMEGLGKEFRIGRRRARYRTLRDTLADGAAGLGRRLRSGFGRTSNQRSASENVMWALRDVSADIPRGAVVGIVGANGAGKSTLLKILARVTEPTTGHAEIHGRVGSLLEVGTGFHPELTGRENIYLSGAVLGMRRAAIDRDFDRIVDFAEVEQFIDTAVKHYSSGMYLRLAFAVAAHLEPEILLLDEVLAVGDAAFQKKCLGKMSAAGKQGRTVLFVSHNMAAVRQLCTSAVLLSDGRLVRAGTSEDIVSAYLTSRPSVPASGEANEHGLALVTVSLHDAEEHAETGSVIFGRDYVFTMTIRAHAPLGRAALVVRIRDEMETLVSSLCTVEEGLDFFELDGLLEVSFSLPRVQLLPGRYAASVFVYRSNDATAYLEVVDALAFDVQPAIVHDAMWPYRKDHGLVRISESVRLSRP